MFFSNRPRPPTRTRSNQFLMPPSLFDQEKLDVYQLECLKTSQVAGPGWWEPILKERHGETRDVVRVRNAAASECRAPRAAVCRRLGDGVGYGRPRSRAVWRGMSWSTPTPSTPNTPNLRSERGAAQEEVFAFCPGFQARPGAEGPRTRTIGGPRDHG